MEPGKVADGKVSSVRRVAIILTATTVADCPLECVCVSTITDPNRKVTCGHYLGSVTNCNGSVVNCGYQGK